MKHHHCDPFAIATYFKLSPRLTFYRLSELEANEHLPLGLLEIDNASGVLYRKEIERYAYRLAQVPVRDGPFTAHSHLLAIL